MANLLSTCTSESGNIQHIPLKMQAGSMSVLMSGS